MKNCPCIPLFGMECEYEKYHKNMLCCSVHIMYHSLQELKRSIPIIGGWFAEYHCPDYEPINKDERGAK